MRVDLVVASRELFGADRSAVRLGRVLTGLGAEVRLVVPTARPDRGLDRVAVAAGLEVAPEPVLVASSRGLSGLPATFRRGRARDAELTIYNSAAVALHRPDARRRVLVLREWIEPGWWRHRALCAWHRRRAAAVVAVSAPVAERWRRCAGDGVAATVCHNWLDDEALAEPAAGDREGILFLGRLNQWKGQLVLADAFERAFGVSGGAPSLTFLGAEEAGSPFHAAAEALRRRCEPLGARVLPFTAEPRELLERAALVVVPSLRPEPFGNVTLEALAAGARVVSFPGGGVDDLAPLFAGPLEVTARGTEPLAEALRRWWETGAPAQTAEERSRVRDVLDARFTATAAAACWSRVLAG